MEDQALSVCGTICNIHYFILAVRAGKTSGFPQCIKKYLQQTCRCLAYVENRDFWSCNQAAVNTSTCLHAFIFSISLCPCFCYSFFVIPLVVSFPFLLDPRYSHFTHNLIHHLEDFKQCLHKIIQIYTTQLSLNSHSFLSVPKKVLVKHRVGWPLHAILFLALSHKLHSSFHTSLKIGKACMSSYTATGIFMRTEQQKPRSCFRHSLGRPVMSRRYGNKSYNSCPRYRCRCRTLDDFGCC